MSADREIVLLRHGIAEDGAPGQPDSERRLTEEGHARMVEIARNVVTAFPNPGAIVASPYVRAQQTAEHVARAYGSALGTAMNMQTTKALVPGASPRELLDFLAAHDVPRMILVGHEPNLSMNAGALTGRAIAFAKGGAVCVRLTGDGAGVVEWTLMP